MPVLTKETRNQCYPVLRQCDEFDALKSLQALFDVPELAPFRDGLPQTDSLKERIEQTIAYLIPKRLRDGRPVFVIFLATLRDRCDPQDQRHLLLEQLRATVEQELVIQSASEDSDQPTAYILVPQRMSQQPNQGITKLIQDAAKEADFYPAIDEPRGVGNIERIATSEVVVAYIASGDADLMMSVTFALAYARHVLLLAREDDHKQLQALFSGIPPILYRSEPGYEGDFKRRVVDALQRIRVGRAEPNFFQKAIPPTHPLRVALHDPERLTYAHHAATVLQNEREALVATFQQMLAAQPKGVDTSFLERRIEQLKQTLTNAEEMLQRLERERNTMLSQAVLAARALENRMVLTSPHDDAPQIFIPATLFVPGPPRLNEDERRQAERFVKAFYMDVFPVTNAQFLRFAEATGYRTIAELDNASEGRDDPAWRTPGGPGSSIDDRMDHPVVWVYREDALAYAKWAGRRLPTQLEWERAMRGVGGQTWPWGEAFAAGRCNLGSNGTTPVDAFPDGASPAGCLDMVGNAWEWLADELAGGKLTLIGGSWAEPELRVGYKRLVVPGDGTDGSTGFRCAMDVPIVNPETK